MEKKNLKYYLAFLLILGLTITAFFYTSKKGTKEMVETTNSKEEIYTDIRDYIKSIDVKEKDLELITKGERTTDDFISNKDKLIFFDAYNTERDKKLAYETLISLSYIVEKDPTYPEKEDFNNIVLRDDYASIPLSLLSPSLLGVDLDLFKEDGEWKIYMKNLVNYVRMAEFYHSERMLNENK